MLGGSPPDTAQPPPPAVWRCLSHRHPSTMYPKPCLFSPQPTHLSEQHATPQSPATTLTTPLVALPSSVTSGLLAGPPLQPQNMPQTTPTLLSTGGHWDRLSV